MRATCEYNISSCVSQLYCCTPSLLTSTATPRENVSGSSHIDSFGALMMSVAQCDKTMSGSGGAQHHKSPAFPVYLFMRPCGEHLGSSVEGQRGWGVVMDGWMEKWEDERMTGRCGGPLIGRASREKRWKIDDS